MVVIYYGFCLDVAQGHMNGAPDSLMLSAFNIPKCM